jgi:hypothetical protein
MTNPVGTEGQRPLTFEFLVGLFDLRRPGHERRVAHEKMALRILPG